MTVTINLPPETEAKLREQADRKGTSLEEFLSGLAQSWAGANGSVAMKSPDEKPQEQWEQEWRAWAASHKPLPIIADDSRESIYAGRGE